MVHILLLILKIIGIIVLSILGLALLILFFPITYVGKANGNIEEPKTNDTTATASEKELLKNYRRLDKYGKTTVKSIINCEYKRVQEQSSQIQEKKHLSSHKNRILHNLYLNIALFVFITAF